MLGIAHVTVSTPDIRHKTDWLQRGSNKTLDNVHAFDHRNEPSELTIKGLILNQTLIRKETDCHAGHTQSLTAYSF